jgi:hypothetical protein
MQTQISHIDLQGLFPDQFTCLAFLEKIKWENGFSCPRCHHKNYCKGSKPFTRQCTKCKYIISPTNNTLFHNIKFPLQKAFCILYYVTTGKGDWASTQLSKQLDLRQKTCWQFKQKVMESIDRKGDSPNFENSGFEEILRYHMQES